jgi:hypothetical protein
MPAVSLPYEAGGPRKCSNPASEKVEAQLPEIFPELESKNSIMAGEERGGVEAT